MAPPSPRRSSRARPTNSQSHQSSISSGTSSRVERTSRHLNKTSSGKSTPSASLSSEPLEEFDDTLLGRRRKRGQDDEQDQVSHPDVSEMAPASDDLQDEEDEAVRCICDSEDYPGRPPVEGPDADFFDGIEFTEDVTGFFVQCDVCKVWQHGACVGIFSAESSPDEYFCELCRKDLHKIHTAANGQKYSKYLPLHQQSRSNSRATSVTKDRTQSPKNEKGRNLRPGSSSAAQKRRSTMNSRDAAYDDEQLLRAIQASKEESVHDTDGSVRRTKRGRSDSEENAPSVKRQRTTSRSQSPPPEQHDDPSQEQSDEEEQTRNGSKKVRNGRHTREKSEKEDKERLRQDAANKRKGRAERRRGEESDPSEELPLTTTKPAPKKSEEPATMPEPAPAKEPTPGTPPPTHTTVSSSHKRGARSSHKRGKARNHYTKEDRDNSPARSMSRDIQRNTDEPSNGRATAAAEHKHSKSKPSLSQKMSMLDMKRRVGAIMDFISRTQVDLAAEGSITPNGDSASGEASPQKTPSAQLNGEAESAADATGQNGKTPSESDKDFKELNCMEMMDVLTRDMVKWQNQYT